MPYSYAAYYIVSMQEPWIDMAHTDNLFGIAKYLRDNVLSPDSFRSFLQIMNQSIPNIGQIKC